MSTKTTDKNKFLHAPIWDKPTEFFWLYLFLLIVSTQMDHFLLIDWLMEVHLSMCNKFLTFNKFINWIWFQIEVNRKYYCCWLADKYRVFFVTVIEYNRHFSVLNCHLEVYYIVDRLLSDDSILCDNSKQRVSIFEKPSIYC